MISITDRYTPQRSGHVIETDDLGTSTILSALTNYRMRLRTDLRQAKLKNSPDDITFLTAHLQYVDEAVEKLERK